ncbi:MAG: 16S rRNA (cytosine(1402)-N(4))-methyltransferase RsmH, partial [Bradyrhizobium sp.]
MTTAAPHHISVLGREAVEMLAPRDGGIYLDATFGAGGYSRAILDTAGTRVIGIDRDRSAITGGFDLVDRSGGRLTLVEDRFSNLDKVCAAQGAEAIDGVVMDVGVSSMQLDQAARGFSFRLGGPLDMRMGHDGPTAADVVAKASEAELANIIYIFGEERYSRAVARAIVAARKEAPIETTKALADIVSKVVHAKPNEIHPATRTF